MATSESDQRPKPGSLRSIIAGSTAGAVEIFFSLFPSFYVGSSKVDGHKQSRRLERSSTIGYQTRKSSPGLPSERRGFVAFDFFKSMLQDEDGKISGPRTVIAGLGAGFTESLLAVTPFESIKTQLIDDRKSASPRMRGFLHGTGVIFRELGVRAFFQGFVPTTARQAANSATRFGSYTTIRQFVQGYVAPGERLGAASTFAIGGLAGLITVYLTQPLDTIKTRLVLPFSPHGMQSIEARKNYKNSFVCATTIFKNEGVLTFWSGALPRLARLVISGGIVFTMYEKTMEGLDVLDPERKYI
ncbi:tricarboxylate transporter [Histoplasma capsulatum H143]|uniref:Tricarboxylate transporter n=1 Tax=Ajellomyces capsulatus (strain H143) TaxID=544712 RepID=C6H8Z4_AJECH|nr:tricarboxylate transporter [Histoplasma capsulatum H143]